MQFRNALAALILSSLLVTPVFNRNAYAEEGGKPDETDTDSGGGGAGNGGGGSTSPPTKSGAAGGGGSTVACGGSSGPAWYPSGAPYVSEATALSATLYDHVAMFDTAGTYYHFWFTQGDDTGPRYVGTQEMWVHYPNSVDLLDPFAPTPPKPDMAFMCVW